MDKIYWNPSFAEQLEIWGEGNVWDEIQLLLKNYQGRVLDCACGTGVAIKKLSKFHNLEVYGFDISDLLIDKAIAKGIPQERLVIADATKTLPWPDGGFDYSYSIGSLEHFTDDGIEHFIADNARLTLCAAFHHVPVSRSGENHGWITPLQAYFNNSEQWWYEKFKRSFGSIRILNSKWKDPLSFGRWFACFKSLHHSMVFESTVDASLVMNDED